MDNRLWIDENRGGAQHVKIKIFSVLKVFFLFFFASLRPDIKILR